MHGAILTWGDRHSTHVTADSPLGWTVHRESFDEAHLALVRALPGVEVIEGAPVRQVEQRRGPRPRAHRRPGARRPYRGRRRRREQRRLPLPPRPRRALHRLRLRGGGAASSRPAWRATSCSTFAPFPRATGWVFPKRDHYSIGGYVFEGGVKGVADLYDEFCAGSSSLAGCETYRRRGYRIPHGGNAGGSMARASFSPATPATWSIRSAARGSTTPCVPASSPPKRRWSSSRASLARRLRRPGAAGDPGRAALRAQAGRVVLRHRRAAFFLLLKNRTVCRWNIEILTGRKSYSSLRDDLLRRAWLLPLQFRPAARQACGRAGLTATAVRRRDRRAAASGSAG